MLPYSKYSIPCALLLLTTACSIEEPPIPPPTSSMATQLTFGTSPHHAGRAHWEVDSNSDLNFVWDADNIGTEVVCAIGGFGPNQTFLPGYATAEANTPPLYATYTTIAPNEASRNSATFRTLNYFNASLSELEGCTLHAVTPVLTNAENHAATMQSDATMFSATLRMPSTFKQISNGMPDYLKPYMYMYAAATIENGDAMLSFKHIPTTLRFKIKNKRILDAHVNSIMFTIDEQTPVASKSVNYAATSNNKTPELTYSNEGHTSVTINIDSDLKADATYTAYTLVLPLPETNAFQDKKIKIYVTTDSDTKILSYELDGQTLYAANAAKGYNVYNWVAGNLYTFNLNLDDVLTFDGIIVEDWNKESIDAGEVEESTENK